jgi:hypothetical protein
MTKPTPIPLYIAIAALLVALLDMPYGYYILLRVAVCAVAVYVALNTRDAAQWAAWAAAVVYNPVFRLPLGRPVWVTVNVATIIGMAFIAWRWKKS